MNDFVILVVIVALVLVGLVVGATWALTAAVRRRRREIEAADGDADGLTPPD